MRQADQEPEAWKRMVLQSMPRPAWLSDDAPHVDVALSTRTRVMRNLAGLRFPDRADDAELESVMRSVISAAESSGLDAEVFRGLTNAERDHLVAGRLVSPDFPWTLPFRVLLVDKQRTASLMVNEEDHLRVQALSAGWSLEASDRQAQAWVTSLGTRLSFAHHPDLGYLSASPYNCGAGRRRSAMLHLIGLAQSKRLPAILQALGSEGMAVRGLFGESSRAIGAFVQISATRGDRTDFVGACEYLMKEERNARNALGREHLSERAQQARDFAVGSPTLPLADALRVLGWARWAAAADVPGFEFSPRDADAALARLELRGGVAREASGRQRAEVLRQLLNA